MSIEQLQSPRTAEREEASFHLTQPVLIRVGGLPREQHDCLSSPVLDECLQQCFDADTRLHQIKDVLIDTLHKELTQHNDSALRAKLLKLKRDVFNLRPFGNRNDANVCIGAVSTELSSLLGRWAAIHSQLEQYLREADCIFKEQTELKRAKLKEIATIPEFRAGLLLSSPVFDRALEEYIRSSHAPLDRKLRRTERTLLLYLGRTCYKTTPFSTLTKVCLGQLKAKPAQPSWSLQSPSVERHVRSYICANLGVLARFVESIKLRPGKLRNCETQLKDGWSEEGDRVRYFRRVVTPLDRAGVLHSSVTESEFWLPASPSLRKLLEAHEKRPRVSLASILDFLSRETALSPEEQESFVSLLLDLDFLVIPSLRRSVFEPYWDHFIEALSRMDDGELHLELDLLRSISQAASLYPGATLTEKRAYLKDMETQCRALLTEPGANLPLPVIYEDAILSGPPLEFPQTEWDTHLRDLASLQRVFPLFDNMTVSKLAMKELFVKMYGVGGQCLELTAFMQFFAETYYRPFQEVLRQAGGDDGGEKKIPNPFHLPAVEVFDAAQSFLWDHWAALQRQHPDAFELELSKEALDTLREAVAIPEKILSHSFFCQLAHGDKEEAIVVNQVHSGMTSMYSRFCRAFETVDVPLAEHLRHTLRELQPRDALFAELQGSHDNNLNLHPLLAPAELLCPGEAGIASPDRQIKLLDLAIIHSRENDCLELIHRQTQQRIIPLYLGFLHPMVLPEMQRLLLHFSCMASGAIQWRRPLVDLELRSIAFRPRLRFQSVVIERGHWIVPVDLIPKRTQGQSDCLYLWELLKWLQQNEIPEHFFITASSTQEAEGGAGEGVAQPQFRVREKPVFIDLKSLFGLFLFEKIIIDAKTSATLTEMYPDRTHAALHGDQGTYVAEYVIELSQG